MRTVFDYSTNAPISLKFVRILFLLSTYTDFFYSQKKL